MKSEIVDQTMRPPPLKTPMMPTIEAAAAASMPMTSWAIGEATARRPMPHVMLTKKIHQSEANCHVLSASLAVTPCWMCVTLPVLSLRTGGFR